MKLNKSAQRDLRLGAMLLTLSLLGAALVLAGAQNWDNAWYLYATERLLAGGVLGVDVVETNPPLFFLFAAPPVAFANLLGADIYAVYCLFVAVAIALSSWFAARLTAQSGFSEFQQGVFGAALVLLQVLVGGENYGQREAVMFALALPFILMSAARLASGAAPNPKHELVAAVFAALGWLIKPYYALVPAGLIIARALQERRLMALFEAPYLAMLALAVVYALAIVLLTPAWFAMMPDIAESYAAGFNPHWRLLVAPFATEALACAVTLACVWLIGGRARAVALILLGVALLYYGGALAQLKGWQNHFLPGRLTLSVALLTAALGVTDWVTWRRRLALAGAAAFLLVLCATGLSNTSALQRDRTQETESSAVMRRAGDRPFLVISAQLQSAFPEVLELGVSWGSRNAHQWMGAGAWRLLHSKDVHEREEGARLAALAARTAAEDIARWRPQLVAVVKPEAEHGWGIDWLGLYASEASFAETWRSYCYRYSTSDWDVYELCEPAPP